jgi:two-component system chemotaxis response regulator CheB
LKGDLDEAAEGALWAAMRALEEKAAMARRMAVTTKKSKGLAERLKEQAEGDTKNANIIRKIIFEEN